MAELDSHESTNDFNRSIDKRLKVYSGKVVEVILDDEKMSYGRIEIIIQEDLDDINEGDPTYAYPADYYNYTLPLVSEMVLCIKDPTGKFYYLSVPSNLIGPIETEYDEEGEEDNEKKEEENLNINTNNDPTFVVDNDDGEEVYGETFIENEEVLPTKVFEGDTIFQGRWGQSMRFSCKNSDNETPWSVDGEDTKPVICIRLGEGQIEDPTEDNAFIYLLSDQSLDFPPESKEHADIEVASTFVGSQVVIGADRLTFISKVNEISLSAASKIGLATPKWSVDFDALMDNLLAIAEQLDALCTAKATLTTGVGPTGPGTNAGDTTAIVTAIKQLEA